MSDQNIFTGPPNWCPFATPAVQGWVNPKTGEVLISVGGNFTTRPEFVNGGYVFANTVPSANVSMWTPANLPANSMPYAITVQDGTLKNKGTALINGPVAPTYVASGPRGMPAMDFGISQSSMNIIGSDVPSGFFVIADFDSYSKFADPSVARKMADYGRLWEGAYGSVPSRPAIFLKHIGRSGKACMVAGGTSTPVFDGAFPTETPNALIARFGADGQGWIDVNGDRSATIAVSPQQITGGMILGSPGTQDFEGMRSMFRSLYIFNGSEADAIRFQGYLAWTGGYQRFLAPTHPYRYGPPLVDNTAKAPEAKLGLTRVRSTYVGYANPTSLAQWKTAMGINTLTHAVEHGDFSSFANMRSSALNAYSVWYNAGFRSLIMTIPLTVAGVSLSAAQAGAGNADLTAIINDAKVKFPNRRVYRLGHEGNVSRFPWSPGYGGAGTAAQYKSCFATVAAFIKSLDPQAIIVFNPAAGFNNLDWTTIVPDASSFDVFGVDAYNQSKNAEYDTMTGWSRFMANVLNTSLGLGFDGMIRTAIALNKPLGVYEYGTGAGGTSATLTTPSSQGGDDAKYVAYMKLIMDEIQCVDDSSYEITDSDYSSRTFLASPPQVSAPTIARDQKPLAAAAFKTAYTGL